MYQYRGKKSGARLVDMVSHSTPLSLALFTSLLTVIISAINLRNGVKATTDGWAYWEGSVSLLNGHGYTYFGGQPIAKFQPLFSIYLAGMQKVFGVSGWSLALSILLLAGLTSFIWSYLIRSLSNPKADFPFQNFIFPVYVSMFIVFQYRLFLSETLFLFFVGLLLTLFAQIYLNRNRQKQLFYRIFFLSIILTLLLFTRNAAVVFVPTVVLGLFIALDNFSIIKRILISLIPGGISLLGWSGLRQFLAQSDSHLLHLGGRYTPLEYITQMLNSMAEFFGPLTLGLGWFVLYSVGVAILYICYKLLWIAKQEIAKQEIAKQQWAITNVLLIVIGSNALLYLLFNLTWIHDRFADRFLWFLVLALVGILAAYATWYPNNKNIYLLSVLLLVTMLQTQRTARFMLGYYAEWPRPYIALNHTIRVDYISGEPINEDGLITVAPPSAYEWIDRHYLKPGK